MLQLIIIFYCSLALSLGHDPRVGPRPAGTAAVVAFVINYA